MIEKQLILLPCSYFKPSEYNYILYTQNTCIKLIQIFKKTCLRSITELLYKCTVAIIQ